jgi:hypothetical protein
VPEATVDEHGDAGSWDATSARTLVSPAWIGKSFLNRIPARCSAERRRISGQVSHFRLARITAVTAGLVGLG